jgi:hypothetical protein
MRTTLDIDDPVLEALKELARRQGRTAGAVASELIYRAMCEPSHSALGAESASSALGFRPFAAAPGEPRVSNDQVNRLREESGV